jgi:hypothetical protein
MIEPMDNVAGNMYGRKDAIRSLQCVGVPMGCGRLIADEEIDTWDKETIQEYSQSGWCKECQDKVFAEPEDIDEGEDPWYDEHPF